MRRCRHPSPIRVCCARRVALSRKGRGHEMQAPSFPMRPDQAAFASTTFGFALPLPMVIWRGFLASGISRTRSTCRSPFSSDGALDLDVVGKLEHALESASGDALVEHLADVLFLHLLLALDGQRVFLRLDRQLVLAEAGDGYGDAIVVLAGALDVVGRVARSGLKAVQHRKQPVEADGRAIEGSKIESSHGISSCERHAVVRRMAGPRGFVQPGWACTALDMGSVLGGSQEASAGPAIGR